MDENMTLTIAAMFARQQLMISMLMEHMASGQPFHWSSFAAKFIIRWKSESTEMIATVLHRFKNDDFQFTLEDLEREGLGPSSSEETDDD